MTQINEAVPIFLIAGALGAAAMFLVTRPSFKLSLPATVDSYPAFGFDYGTDIYNNSEVWDTRDRVFKNDNVLYNKTPHIDLKPYGGWDPSNPDFMGSYSACGDDSPRPRLEHFLNSM